MATNCTWWQTPGWRARGARRQRGRGRDTSSCTTARRTCRGRRGGPSWSTRRRGRPSPRRRRGPRAPGTARRRRGSRTRRGGPVPARPRCAGARAAPQTRCCPSRSHRSAASTAAAPRARAHRARRAAPAPPRRPRRAAPRPRRTPRATKTCSRGPKNGHTWPLSTDVRVRVCAGWGVREESGEWRVEGTTNLRGATRRGWCAKRSRAA